MGNHGNKGEQFRLVLPLMILQAAAGMQLFTFYASKESRGAQIACLLLSPAIFNPFSMW